MQNTESIENKPKKPNNFRMALGSLGCTVFLLVSLVLCASALVQVLNQGYVNLGGYSLFRVVTGSMEPTIPVGSLLVCQQTDIGSIAEGDVVCFQSVDTGRFGKVITHRVADVIEQNGETALVTKGDANPVTDGTVVTARNLLGRVVWYSHKGNLGAVILGILGSKMGFLICILLPAMIICALVMRDCVRTMKEQIEMLNRLEARAKAAPPAAPKPMTLEEMLGKEEYDRLCEQIKAELRKELHL